MSFLELIFFTPFHAKTVFSKDTPFVFFGAKTPDTGLLKTFQTIEGDDELENA